MLSKQQQKYIQSLHNKKNRQQENVFLVEGMKNCSELLTSNFKVKRLYATEKFILAQKNLPDKVEIIKILDEELQKISTIKSNDAALAVVEMKPNSPLFIEENEWVLVLDTINDPGNLGTIIRIADWYGISKIICSPQTVEHYNPKVIMASMGSFTRVSIFVSELEDYLSKVKLPVLGAFLEGKSIYDFPKTKGGFLVIGSESHGISEETSKYIYEQVTIPRLGSAESLNAGIATAILLDNLLRK